MARLNSLCYSKWGECCPSVCGAYMCRYNAHWYLEIMWMYTKSVEKDKVNRDFFPRQHKFRQRCVCLHRADKVSRIVSLHSTNVQRDESPKVNQLEFLVSFNQFKLPNTHTKWERERESTTLHTLNWCMLLLEHICWLFVAKHKQSKHFSRQIHSNKVRQKKFYQCRWDETVFQHSNSVQLTYPGSECDPKTVDL